MIISQSGMIDLVPEYNRALRPIFCVSEGDADSRMINITVQNAGNNFNIPEGASVYVAGKKLDNTIFTYECSYSGYIVTFPITEQMSAVSGLVLCEIQIVVAGDPLGSANFCFWVEPSPIENGTTSESDLNIFVQAIADLGGYEFLTDEVAVLSARMDQFARLPDGSLSTAADAELADIRVKADGTTAATAGDAVREQITGLKSAFDSVTFDKVGTNINNCGYEGGYIASNGTDTTASSLESVSFRSNGYIPVVGGKTLYWWGRLTSGDALGANAVIVEYDANKNLIGERNQFDKYGTTGVNQAFTTSQNAAYVRIALYQGVEDKSTIQIALYYSGDEQEAFVPYQGEKVINYNKVYTESGESLDDVIDGKISDIGFTPLYEKQAITVTGVQGALKPDGTVTETKDVTRYKIPVSAGEKYVVSARHGYAYKAFLVLDSNDKVLSYYPNTTSGTAIHRNVEVNIAEDGFLVVQDVYKFPPYIGKAVSVDFNDKLYQKSIYWNGDSICFGAGGFSFANQIGLIHAMPETMDAVSGTRLSIRTGRTDSIYDRVVAMDTTAEYDFIGIEGGYNDYFSSVAIGTLMANYTDSPDTTTVIGAVEGICKHIRTNFPNSKFFFVLGHRPIAVGAYPTDVDTYWDAIISALEKWAVPYVDIRKEGTLMAYNADWLADYFGHGETMGTHPNTEGYTKFYNPLVEDIMKSL